MDSTSAQIGVLGDILQNPKFFENPFNLFGNSNPIKVKDSGFEYEVATAHEMTLFRLSCNTNMADAASAIDRLLKKNSIVIVPGSQNLCFINKGYRVIREGETLSVLFKGIVDIEQVKKELAGKSRLKRVLEGVVAVASTTFLGILAFSYLKELPLSALSHRLLPIVKESFPFATAIFALYLGSVATRYM